jgi:hypothetical protein
MSLRVGEVGGKIYLDLCDAKWRNIEIDENGWRIVDQPEARFRRSPNMKALPEPVINGSAEGLRRFLNIGDDDADFIMAKAYLLATLRPRGPYPVNVVGGDQGTAKSTRSALLSGVVDPRRPALRSLPRDERDLFIAARNRHVLGFDNVSGISVWLSDALCRVASGSGFRTRQLYSDDDEILFDGARPIVLNGIEEIVDCPDLAERSIFSVCELITDENRKSEEEVYCVDPAEAEALLNEMIADAAATGALSSICPPPARACSTV